MANRQSSTVLQSDRSVARSCQLNASIPFQLVSHVPTIGGAVAQLASVNALAVAAVKLVLTARLPQVFRSAWVALFLVGKHAARIEQVIQRLALAIVLHDGYKNV
jgi:hypothetical protein